MSQTAVHGCTDCRCRPAPAPMATCCSPKAGDTPPFYTRPRIRSSERMFGAQLPGNHVRMLQILALLREATDDLAGALESLGRVMHGAEARLGRREVEDGQGTAV